MNKNYSTKYWIFYQNDLTIIAWRKGDKYFYKEVND